MKAELVRRVARLEGEVASEASGIALFTQAVAPGHEGPVAGWSFGPWEDRVQVLREDGENDEALKARAVALFREQFPGEVPSLVSANYPSKG